MTNGLILVVFLGVLVAFGWLRLRRRMGMAATGSTFVAIVAGFVIAVLAYWAYTQK